MEWNWMYLGEINEKRKECNGINKSCLDVLKQQNEKEWKVSNFVWE